MLMLVYDPAIVTDPETLAASLGTGALVRGVPQRYSFTLPAAGYAVVRETWAGTDILPGPVTAAEVLALPDPGPNPVHVAEAEKRESAAILRAEEAPDLATLRTLVEGLRAYMALPSPTAAQSAAALRALIRLTYALAKHVT